MSEPNAIKNLDELFKKMGREAQPTAPDSEKYYKHYHSQNIKDRKQRRKQRERLDNRIFGLLVGQVIFLVVLIILQGFKIFGFNLNEWTFGLFVNGSLIQTYLLVRYITADLYTETKN